MMYCTEWKCELLRRAEQAAPKGESEEPFTAEKFVLEMCENVGVRRVKTSNFDVNTSDSDIFTPFQNKFSNG